MHTLLGHTLQEKGPERKGTWVHLGLDEKTKIRETKASPCVCPKKKNSQLDTLMQAPHSSGFSHDSYFETLKSFISVPPKPKKKPLTTQLWCPGGNLLVSGSSLGSAQKAGASTG